MQGTRTAFVATIAVAFLMVVGIYTLAHTQSQVVPVPDEPVSFIPTRTATTSEPVVSAEAYIAVYVGETGEHTILLQKNEHAPLPIASVSKLMTAYASSELLAQSTVTVPEEVLVGKGRTGWYQEGMLFPTHAAYSGMLIASHNELAETFAFAAAGSLSAFAERMNLYAHRLGLYDTSYVNPSGLDPYQIAEPVNRSSAYDIYMLFERIEKEKPTLFEITGTRDYVLADMTYATSTELHTTNELLHETVGVFRVVGGKTGETPRAKQALVIATDAPCDGRLYSVVLRSDNRFLDMRTLLAYLSDSFAWTCPSSGL